MSTQCKKQYVPVVVRFDADGKLRPQIIEFDKEHKYSIDKILDVRRAACQTVGGVGCVLLCGYRDTNGTFGWSKTDGLLLQSRNNEPYSNKKIIPTPGKTALQFSC